MADAHGPKFALFRDNVTKLMAHLKTQPRVWDEHRLEEKPAERVRRHRYDALTKAWTVDTTLFKVDTEPFDEGAMRICFRARKVHFGHVVRFHPLRWKAASNYVVKGYKGAAPDGVDDRRAFDDVAFQTEAARWADDYNRSRPPKPIKMISLLQFFSSQARGCGNFRDTYPDLFKLSFQVIWHVHDAARAARRTHRLSSTWPTHHHWHHDFRSPQPACQWPGRSDLTTGRLSGSTGAAPSRSRSRGRDGNKKAGEKGDSAGRSCAIGSIEAKPPTPHGASLS